LPESKDPWSATVVTELLASDVADVCAITIPVKNEAMHTPPLLALCIGSRTGCPFIVTAGPDESNPIRVEFEAPEWYNWQPIEARCLQSEVRGLRPPFTVHALMRNRGTEETVAVRFGTDTAGQTYVTVTDQVTSGGSDTQSIVTLGGFVHPTDPDEATVTLSAVDTVKSSNTRDVACWTSVTVQHAFNDHIRYTSTQ
jgi:hypothetical protein